MESPGDDKQTEWEGANPWSQQPNPETQNKLQSRCDECGCGDFENGDDGFFYCTNCGYQSQHLIETAINEDDIAALGETAGLYSVRHTARYSQSSQPPSQQPFVPTQEDILKALAGPDANPEEDEQAEEMDRMYGFLEDEDLQPREFGAGPVMDAVEVVEAVRLRYLQGLQIMVQMQCQALVQEFQVTPMICGIVGAVWLRFVAASRVCQDGWDSRVIEESEDLIRHMAGEDEPIYRRIRCKDRHEPHNMYGKRAILIWLRSLKLAVPLQSTLAASFLACHIARQSVLPIDIVKWVHQAKLPYITAFSAIEKVLGKPSRACPLRTTTLFRPRLVAGPWDLEAKSGLIAKSIGLLLPCVNFHEIASRCLKQLGLPLEKILPFACRVYEWSTPVELRLSANKLRIPTHVNLMAILIVTIRILYKIHGHGVWETSIAKLNCYDKDETEDRNREHISSSTTHFKNLKEEDVAHRQTSEYNATNLLRSLETAYHKMSKIKNDHSEDFESYLKYCKDVVFAGVSKSYEEQSLIERLWQIYEAQDNGKPEGIINVSQKRDREEVETRIEDCNKVKSRLEEPSHINTTEDVPLNNLKLDMEDNWFQYIPPRHSKSRYYIQYTRKKSWGKFYYVASADYYVLLRPFARLAEVDVRIMHLAVMTLERRLAWTEKRIKSSLLSLHDRSVDAMLAIGNDNPELD